MLKKLAVAYPISITSIVSREKFSSATKNGKCCISCSVKGASIIFVKSFIATIRPIMYKLRLCCKGGQYCYFIHMNIFMFITLSRPLFLSLDVSMLCYICQRSLPR
jgi:hypothetical protein